MANEDRSYNARLVGLDPSTLEQELEAVGAQPPGQHIMLHKGSFLAIKLDNLSCVAANVLKQEMLARGGDCAVHMDCLTLERDETAVLLTGTRAQYDDLIAKLHWQGFDLPDVARQIAELLANVAAEPKPLQLGPYTLPLHKRTLVMGVINTTPDSFSGDSLGDDLEGAVAQARRMHAEGADLLDIGGQSTRPGSEPVSPEEELRRVLPLIRRLAGRDGVPLPLSVDTSRAEVARAAVEAGALLINDITGLRDNPELANVAASTGAALVLMHIQGSPSTMQQHPHYDDLLGEVTAYLREGISKAVRAGVNRERIWVDPGLGFGKTVSHNLELLRRLGELRSLGCPVLVGPSRKGFLGRVLAPLYGGEAPPPQARVVATGAALTLSIANGASIVRVHDVAQAVEVARVADAIVRGVQYTMPLVYLGIGTNLGDRRANINKGVQALGQLPGAKSFMVSRLYCTAAWGKTDQPDFYNMVVRTETTLEPLALLAECKRIEREAGRTEGERWGPRVLDIDILLYEGVTLHTPQLTIPHPRMWERRFVLEPLGDLWPDYITPGGMSLSELLAEPEIAAQEVHPCKPESLFNDEDTAP